MFKIYYNKSMKSRIRYIDFFRGLAIINMVVYHFLYDLKYIFSVDINFTIDSFYSYQQYIAISFIFLSGLSSNYSGKLLKNGIKLFVISICVTLITKYMISDLVIYFDILHFLSIGMIFIWLYRYTKGNKKYTENTYNILFIMMMVIFISLKILLNIEEFYMIFHNVFKSVTHSFILGFPSSNFSSGDYFPLIPWIFLMFSGYFFSRTMLHQHINKIFNNIKIFNKLSFIETIGRYSLIIYILHQIVIYGVLYFIFA